MEAGEAVKVRDLWRLERAAGISGGIGWPWREAECWEVTVTEVNYGTRPTWTVTGVLVAQIHPERWCLDTKAWLPVEAEPVPGVTIGGERSFKALGLARDAARDLITLLSGKMSFAEVRLVHVPT